MQQYFFFHKLANLRASLKTGKYASFFKNWQICEFLYKNFIKTICQNDKHLTIFWINKQFQQIPPEDNKQFQKKSFDIKFADRMINFIPSEQIFDDDA